MNDTNLLYLVYGMCIMFHLMMGWVFCCRKQGLAKKLIGLLMLLVAVQYAKDLVFLPGFYTADPVMERIASSIDIVTVPLYVLILIEFCRPGWLSKMRAFLLEAPILLLSLLYLLLRIDFFFEAMVVLSIIYGIGCALWTLRELPRYHRRLKEEYSYDEDINLHWMRGVMVLFFVILLLWAFSNVCPSPLTDLLYMSSSLVGWVIVCYFINKQETVLRDVISGCDEPGTEAVDSALATETIVDADIPDTNVMSNNNTSSDTETITQLRNRLQQCFEEDKVYLDPKLRLSELAARLGTNRTYLSQYFNHSCAQSFYEYVNEYRVRHSMQLLHDTDYTLEVVASMSGFNSLSTFRRAFSQANGCSPLQYRAECRLENIEG
uniref:helix-turn-helix domain-containing protein n=1 Tax=Prevotella sp. TaxID=59823 RepID=UPI00402767BD